MGVQAYKLDIIQGVAATARHAGTSSPPDPTLTLTNKLQSDLMRFQCRFAPNELRRAAIEIRNIDGKYRDIHGLGESPPKLTMVNMALPNIEEALKSDPDPNTHVFHGFIYKREMTHEKITLTCHDFWWLAMQKRIDQKVFKDFISNEDVEMAHFAIGGSKAVSFIDFTASSGSAMDGIDPLANADEIQMQRAIRGGVPYMIVGTSIGTHVAGGGQYQAPGFTAAGDKLAWKFRWNGSSLRSIRMFITNATSTGSIRFSLHYPDEGTTARLPGTEIVGRTIDAATASPAIVTATTASVRGEYSVLFDSGIIGQDTAKVAGVSQDLWLVMELLTSGAGDGSEWDFCFDTRTPGEQTRPRAIDTGAGFVLTAEGTARQMIFLDNTVVMWRTLATRSDYTIERDLSRLLMRDASSSPSSASTTDIERDTYRYSATKDLVTVEDIFLELISHVPEFKQLSPGAPQIDDIYRSISIPSFTVSNKSVATALRTLADEIEANIWIQYDTTVDELVPYIRQRATTSSPTEHFFEYLSDPAEQSRSATQIKTDGYVISESLGNRKNSFAMVGGKEGDDPIRVVARSQDDFDSLGIFLEIEKRDATVTSRDQANQIATRELARRTRNTIAGRIPLRHNLYYALKTGVFEGNWWPAVNLKDDVNGIDADLVVESQTMTVSVDDISTSIEVETRTMDVSSNARDTSDSLDSASSDANPQKTLKDAYRVERENGAPAVASEHVLGSIAYCGVEFEGMGNPPIFSPGYDFGHGDGPFGFVVVYHTDLLAAVTISLDVSRNSVAETTNTFVLPAGPKNSAFYYHILQIGYSTSGSFSPFEEVTDVASHTGDSDGDIISIHPHMFMSLHDAGGAELGSNTGQRYKRVKTVLLPNVDEDTIAYQGLFEKTNADGLIAELGLTSKESVSLPATQKRATFATVDQVKKADTVFTGQLDVEL